MFQISTSVSPTLAFTGNVMSQMSTSLNADVTEAGKENFVTRVSVDPLKLTVSTLCFMENQFNDESMLGWMQVYICRHEYFQCYLWFQCWLFHLSVFESCFIFSNIRICSPFYCCWKKFLRRLRSDRAILERCYERVRGGGGGMGAFAPQENVLTPKLPPRMSVF